MENTNWFKQATDKPLFEDLLWSRPENKRYAGKLLIVGGNLHSFAAPATAFAAATKAGIGTCRVVLPDATQKILGRSFHEAEFAPSTPSGSFAKTALGQLLEAAAWADGVLLAGDFGRNSETAILLESFLEKFSGQVSVAGDGLDYFLHGNSKLLSRPQTLSVINLGKLQKLGKNNRPSTPIRHAMSLHELVKTLSTWTAENDIGFITHHQAQFVAARGGKVSTTPDHSNLTQTLHLDEAQGAGEQQTEPYMTYAEGVAQPATQRFAKSRAGVAGSAGKQVGEVQSLRWQVELAAYASVWMLQQPQKTFEALTTAIFDFAKFNADAR